MYILYQMHVTWFETEMALESIQSLKEAIQNTNLEVKVKLCFNKQTRFDTPINKSIDEMFNELLNDDLVKQSEIVWKTDNDKFYNIGDWRRECYDSDNITIWGEADCLIPNTYFGYIESIFSTNQTYPFIVTIKQKKMWDASWTPTEHEAFQQLSLDQVRAINNKFVTGEGFLSYTELNKFNDSFSQNHNLTSSNYYKGDGALVCLSPKMPTPFIAPKLQLMGEDTYFFTYCQIKQIPLYNICYYLKGHNTAHPLKRTNHFRNETQHKEFAIFDQQQRMIASESLNQLI
jgi:hypothetical protein